ncbi:MAG TPA: peptidylprolyl isomerase [Candidatus Udaeobacter sp.]|nr:peptidylprolyl isomerase [Candidatus Udaeobacter sp.]
MASPGFLGAPLARYFILIYLLFAALASGSPGLAAVDGTGAEDPSTGAEESKQPTDELSDIEAPDLSDAEESDPRLRPANPAYEDSTLMARVGNDPVTAGDLYYALDFARGMNRHLPPDSLRAVLIDKAVNQKLLTQEAKRLGYERAPALVSAMTLEEDRLVTRELVRRIYAGKLTVSEAELRELYERYFYTLRVLHLSVDEQPRAEELRKRIEAGENFGDLARLYSEDKKTAPQGGDMGEVKAGRLVVTFEDVVFALEPGQLSEVIKGRGEHYKLFKLLAKDRDREPSHSYAEMREALAKRVRTRKAAQAKYQWEQSLLAKYELTIDEENYKIFSHRLRDQIASWEAINSVKRDSLSTAWIFTDWPPEELVLPIARWKGGQMTCAEFNKVSREMRVCPTCLWRDSDVQLRMFVLGRAFDHLFEFEKRAIRLERIPSIATELGRRREARLGEMVAASLLVRQADIPDAEAQSYWEAHREQYMKNPRARAQRIVVETEAQASEILDRLRGGADFAALAKRYSKDETTNWNGGETDWFTPGSMYGMADVALKHPVGELIPPFRSDLGWEVVKVLAKEPATPMSFEEAKNSVRQRMATDRTAAQLQAKLAELRGHTPIQIDEAALARLNLPS